MAASNRRRRISDSAWDSILEAVSVFYWYKPDQERFLRGVLSDEPAILAGLSFGQTKRQVASELVVVLQSDERRYQAVALDLIERLATFDSRFDHLARLEDGVSKVAAAQAALKAVQAVTGQNRRLLEERERLRERIENDAQESELRRTHDAVLMELCGEFLGMATLEDVQARGRQLEGLLQRLFALHDLDPRASYSLEHEQIDGAFTFRTDDYLLEAKWWAASVDPRELNHFRAKVESKAANTLGLCISISGFTPGSHSKTVGTVPAASHGWRRPPRSARQPNLSCRDARAQATTRC